MNFTTNITLNLLLFQGIAFVILGVLWIWNSYKNHILPQPLERIRLFQLGLCGIGITGLLLLLPFGSKWTLVLPTPEIQEQTPIIATPPPVDFVSQTPVVTPPQEQIEFVTPLPIQVPALELVSTQPVEPFRSETVIAEMVPVENTISPSVKSGIDYLSFVLLAFCVPAVVLGISACFAKITLLKLLARSVAAPESVRTLLEHIDATAARKIDLRTSKDIDTPMIFGVIKTTLLVPEKMLDTPEALRAALAHELSHFQRGDLRTLALVRLFQYVLWPQPMYWHLRRQLLIDQDFLADHDAAEQLADRTDYAEILYDMAKSRKAPQNVLAMATSKKSQLTRRIEMILGLANTPLELTLNKRRLVTPLVILLLLCLLGGAIRIGENKAREKTNENAQTVSEEKELISITKSEKLYEIKGTVYNADGKPASGAEILCYEASYGGPEDPVKADEQGRFQCEMKKLFLLVARSHDEENIFVHKFSKDPQADKIIATLSPGEQLKGRVVDKDGQPIDNATVGYEGAYRTNRLGKSDSEGHFTFFYPKELGVNSLFALKGGAGFQYKIFAAEQGEKFPVPDQGKVLREFMELKLSGAKPIKLTMVWEDGTPIPGVTIDPWLVSNPDIVPPPSMVSSSIFMSTDFNFAMYQYFAQKTTDENGVAVFDWTPDCLSNIEFFYKLNPQNKDERSKRLRLNFAWAPLDPHEKTVVNYRTKKLKGTVRLPDGSPAEGVTVKYEGGKLNLENVSGSTKTDSEGRYELEIVPETLSVLGVEDEQWTAPAHNPLVVNKNTTQQELEAFDFTLQKKTRVYGKVKFGEEDQKLKGQSIGFELLGKSDKNLPKEKQLTRPKNETASERDIRCYWWYKTSIDDDGNYSINLGPGEYSLNITEHQIGVDGYNRSLLEGDVKLIVPENKTDQLVEQNYDIQTNASLNGTINGTIVLSDGKPAANAVLHGAYYDGPDYVFRSSTPDFTATTDANGKFDTPRTLKKMILFVKSEAEKESAIVSLTKDATGITVTLKPLGSVKATLVDKRTKKPVANGEFFYGIQVYGLGSEADKNWDEQYGYPKRFHGPLRFGDKFKTDSQGNFKLENLVSGAEYQLAFRPRKDIRRYDTCTFQICEFTTPVEELGKCELNTRLLDGALTPEEIAVPQFTVTVLDDETGKPIVDTEIRPNWALNPHGKLYPYPWYSSEARGVTGTVVGTYRTDALGKASFKCLPSQYKNRLDTDKIELIISCGSNSGYDRSTYITGYAQTLGGFEEPREFTVRLKKYPSVSGKIVDVNGKPIDGALLKITTNRKYKDEETVKHEDGSRSIYGSPGWYKIFETATKADGSFTTLTAVDFNEGNLMVIPQENVPVAFNLDGKSPAKPEDWVFTIPSGKTASGTVLDAERKGIANIWVNFLLRRKAKNASTGQEIEAAIPVDYDFGRSARTDSQGRFIVHGLDEKKYDIFISREPTSPNTEGVKPPEHEYPKPKSPYFFDTKIVDLAEEKTVLRNMEFVSRETVKITYKIDAQRLPQQVVFNDSVRGDEKEIDNDPHHRTATVYVPKNQPVTLCGQNRYHLLGLGSGVEVINLSYEYRLSPDEPWKPIQDAGEQTDTVLVSLGPFETDCETLEIRIP